jgi:multiple sugar transport system permease protein
MGWGVLKRALAVLAVVGLTAVNVSGGWIEDVDGGTIIHVKPWELPDPSITTPNHQAEWQILKKFVSDFPATFEKKYRARYAADPARYGRHDWSHVEVRMHKFSGIRIEGMSLDAKPLMAIAGGVAPDILYVNFRQSETYIRNGFLYPLDKPEDGYFSSMSQTEIDYCINPRIWPVIKRRGPDCKVHVWAKPYSGIVGKVFLYRKDLLDAAGMAYPNNDWSWSDLYNYCRKIADPARGIYGMAVNRGIEESYHWLGFLWSAGGEVMRYDAKQDAWRACFATAAGAQALDFYVRLLAEPWRDAAGHLRFGYVTRESASRKWRMGQVAFIQAYIDTQMFQTINPDLIGMVAVPQGPDGIRGGEINAVMRGLYSGIKDVAVRDAAWEYMRFTSSREANRIRTSVMVEGGLGRFVNPRYLREFGYDDIIRFAPQGWEQTFKIAMESGRPEPYGRNCQAIYRYLTAPIRAGENLMLKGRLPQADNERLAQLQQLLTTAQQNANEKMIGLVPPGTMRLRRISASIFLVAIVLSFYFLFRRVIQNFSPPAITGHCQSGHRKYFWAYVLIAPAVLSILFWQYLPLLIGSKMAFQDYQIVRPSVWVGVDNFANILWDADWWHSIWNSWCYSLLVISLTFLPPVILAVLLDEVPHGKMLFRTLFYLPAVITGLVVVYLWRSFYDNSDSGVLNRIVMSIPGGGYVLVGGVLLLVLVLFARRLYLQQAYWGAAACILAGLSLFVFSLGFVWNLYGQLKISAGPGEQVAFWQALFHKPPLPTRWLDDPATALLCCVLPMVWMGMGPGCLIYLAALKGIAPDFYEAADMDGATFIDKILFIVIPSLKPLLIINFVGVFIASWKNSAFILAMTGMSKHTEVAGLHIFFEAYTRLKFGSAAAMAWALGFMLIWFTVHQLKILSRLEFRTTGD